MANDETEVDIAYQAAIHDGLNQVLKKIEPNETPFDHATDKYIIFSDQHKGARDGADDFQKCEKAYNAALGYYFEAGHTLIILGDAEDLWECRPGSVVNAYKETLSLEAEFLEGGRYYRVWGNHDDLWSTPGEINKHFNPIVTKKSTPCS